MMRSRTQAMVGQRIGSRSQRRSRRRRRTLRRGRVAAQQTVFAQSRGDSRMPSIQHGGLWARGAN
eukprot:2304037-Prymnesium_polylepis.1